MLTEVINDLYRNDILANQYSTVDELFRAWENFQSKFIKDNTSYKKYEIWTQFSLERIKDGINKVNRIHDSNRNTKVTLLEQENSKLKSTIDSKQSERSDKERYEKEINQLKKENMEFSKKEQTLKQDLFD